MEKRFKFQKLFITTQQSEKEFFQNTQIINTPKTSGIKVV